jgi:serine/threonine-protein kinase
MYLVMPLIVGATLRTTLLDGPIPWLRATRLAEQLLAGLAALHRLGTLHGDVKPENCLMAQVDGREHLRLADLGLAQMTTAGLAANPLVELPKSRRGALLGTAAYTSPEQAQGVALDERSDIYAAGVVLYELLTRRVPFRGTDREVLSAHVHIEPPEPRKVAPKAGIPGQLEAVTLRALAKEPSRRFQTAEALQAALADACVVATHGGGSEPALQTSTSFAAAQASLAAWTRFEYDVAHGEAVRAARLDPAWLPLKLMMSGLVDA